MLAGAHLSSAKFSLTRCQQLFVSFSMISGAVVEVKMYVCVGCVCFCVRVLHKKPLGWHVYSVDLLKQQNVKVKISYSYFKA